MHFITKTHISLTSWVLNTFLFPYDSKWTAQHIYPQILSWVFVVESHRWDSVGKKKKKESKRELKTAPCLTDLLFWVIDGNKLKCNFSFSIWREIIFWILKFWQEAAVKMACQSNDFLSSYSSVKGKILFLLIFNFYSFPADFLFLNIFFFPSDSFSSTLLLRFLRFSLAPNWDSSAVIGLCNSQFWQHSQPSCLFAAVY